MDKLTPGNIAAFLVAIGLAWFLYKGTKHLIFGLFCLAAALMGAGYLTGVITPKDTKAAMAAAREAGKEGIDAAEARAKALGGPAYDPSMDKRATFEHAYQKTEPK